MSMRMGLHVVRDNFGRQWLCPRKPTRSLGSWLLPIGSIILDNKGDGLDEDCFEGDGNLKAYKVEVILSR
jgi:hypothetical protein